MDDDFTYYNSLFDYDRETGELHWRVARNGRMRVGQLAGTWSNGYISINVDGRKIYAHRIVWLLCKGEWPTNYIDHINGNKADNRIENLRDVSASDNIRNTARSRNPDKYIYQQYAGYSVQIALPQCRTIEEARVVRQRAVSLLTEHGLLPTEFDHDQLNGSSQSVEVSPE
jgi:hypothetical protein